eukprot:TRINITY_DN25981_c0_g1_i3.p1 TRINITY_DN25981_c0_g1~~TRINITY_DN25981_c0_g1_i3.p1  ORF type:complete len:419 (+),score=123.32 TRINITY_DN25981_c0_g1_i3:60-1259(+)
MMQYGTTCSASWAEARSFAGVSGDCWEQRRLAAELAADRRRLDDERDQWRVELAAERAALARGRRELERDRSDLQQRMIEVAQQELAVRARAEELHGQLREFERARDEYSERFAQLAAERERVEAAAVQVRLREAELAAHSSELQAHRRFVVQGLAERQEVVEQRARLADELVSAATPAPQQAPTASPPQCAAAAAPSSPAPVCFRRRPRESRVVSPSAPPPGRCWSPPLQRDRPATPPAPGSAAAPPTATPSPPPRPPPAPAAECHSEPGGLAALLRQLSGRPSSSATPGQSAGRRLRSPPPPQAAEGSSARTTPAGGPLPQRDGGSAPQPAARARRADSCGGGVDEVDDRSAARIADLERLMAALNSPAAAAPAPGADRGGPSPPPSPRRLFWGDPE